MALGTNYARTGIKTDMLVRLGLYRMKENGWTRAQVDKELKRLRREKAGYVYEYVRFTMNAPQKSELVYHCWGDQPCQHIFGPPILVEAAAKKLSKKGKKFYIDVSTETSETPGVRSAREILSKSN